MNAQIITVLASFLKKKIPFILVATTIFISYFFVQKNEIITFMVFIILVPIFAVFKFDGRISLGYAVLLLILVGILVFMKEQDFVDQLVVSSYWLLVVGILCSLIALYREKKWKMVNE
jgi:hypothetical protein